MALSAEEVEFVQGHPTAAMVTVGADGAAKVARVGVAVVEGRIWSSGTTDRARTRRLRRDPRCTLFVFEAGFKWLALEATVTLLEGPDAAQHNVTLFRVMQRRPAGPLNWFGEEMAEEAMLARMRQEDRLIYQFEVQRSYGLL